MGFWRRLLGSSNDVSEPVTGAGSTLPQVSDTVEGIPITPGDTLSELGRDNNFDWGNSQIVRNGQVVDVDPSQVQVGDIVVPNTHTVQSGDTLSEIARDNGFNYNDAQIIRDGKVYDIGENGIPADQIQPGDQIISPNDSVTQPTEQAAEEEASSQNPEKPEAGCRGWISIFSHYMNFDKIAVSYKITITNLDTGAVVINDEEVKYTAIASAVTAIPEKKEDAVVSGNSRVLFGGEEGFELGKYKIAIKPSVAHGKLRINKTPIASGGMLGRYQIYNTDGTLPTEPSNVNTTDKYLQVPSDTAVEIEWNHEINVACGNSDAPQTVEFVWTDFKANPNQRNRTDNGIRTLHPQVRHLFYAFFNTVEDRDKVYTVTDSFRTPVEQDRLYASPASNARRWQSLHCYGLAVDTYDTRSNPIGAVTIKVANIGRHFGLAPGMDFGDTPHFAYPSESHWRTLIQYVAANNNELKEAHRILYDGRYYVKTI